MDIRNQMNPNVHRGLSRSFSPTRQRQLRRHEGDEMDLMFKAAPFAMKHAPGATVPHRAANAMGAFGMRDVLGGVPT